MPPDNGSGSQGALAEEAWGDEDNPVQAQQGIRSETPGALPSSQTGLQIRYGQQAAKLGLSDTASVAHHTMAHMSARTEENYDEMWMEQEPTLAQTQMGCS